MDEEHLQLVERIGRAIAGLTTEKDILATTARMIDAFSDDFNWTGFYMMRNGVLEVGPYCGPRTEHVQIELNRGICGAAASQKKTLIVEDVRSDSRFLACSLTTRSEIVVPLLDGDRVLGEIDIDSDRPGNFTAEDREMLEAIAVLVVKRLKDTA